MSESIPSDIQAEAIRIQHVLEETLDRSAGRSEVERAEALASALRHQIAALPAGARGPVVAALGAIHPEEPVVTHDGAAAARIAALEDEVARLRERLAAAAVARPARAAAPEAGDLARRLVELLLGPGRDVDGLLGEGAAAEARVIAVLKALVGFSAELHRAVLGATVEADRTMAGRLQGQLAEELQGKVPAGGFAAELEQMQRAIGHYHLAFQKACEDGAREVLKQLAPAALEAEAAKQNRGVLFNISHHKDLWRLFDERYERLRTADDLFETYFDGAYRAALKRLSGPGQERRGRR